MKTTTRKEYKYLISYQDYIKIEPLIKSFLNHDKHGLESSYPVNSIYLDDIYHSGAMDKAFGNELHRKYRLRYYDDSKVTKFELKEKTGDISTKHSLLINEELKHGILTGDINVIEKYLDEPLIRKFLLSYQLNLLSPVNNIRYSREAYRDDSDNLRVTFDFQLEVSEYDNSVSYTKLMNDTNLILEVKYEHFLPKQIKTILNQIALNQIAYSKYFLGYNQFNY